MKKIKCDEILVPEERRNRKFPLTFLRPQRRRRRIVYDFEKYYLYNLCMTVWDKEVRKNDNKKRETEFFNV